MRIVFLGAAAALVLGSGLAVSLQAARAPVQPIEAPREISEAAAAPTLVAAEPTPFEFRQVRTVPIREPGAEQTSAPAAPVQAARVDEVQPRPRAEAAEDRPMAAADSKAPAAASVPTVLAALPEAQESDVTSAREPKQEISSSERPVTRAHRASKRSFRVAKQSRRARRAAEIAAAEPPAPPPVYDGRNEYHSPLGKLLGSAK